MGGSKLRLPPFGETTISTWHYLQLEGMILAKIPEPFGLRISTTCIHIEGTLKVSLRVQVPNIEALAVWAIVIVVQVLGK